MPPLTLALIGVLAYRIMHGKGRLAEMLGMESGGTGAAGSAPTGQPQTGATAGQAGNPGGWAASADCWVACSAAATGLPRDQLLGGG